MHLVYDDIEDIIKFVEDTVLKEAKKENRLTKQLLITMLSASGNNPINLLINAPSGVGKNYVINKVAELFPEKDILSLAGMTDKALFHRPGTLVIKNQYGEYESIENIIKEIDEQIADKENDISNTNNRYTKQAFRSIIIELKQEKKDLLKDARKLIDLSNKIIIFLDTPKESLLAGLLPLLSHDKYEVEYEFTDTHNGIQTRNNVLRGFPAVIIAQALDYSHSPRFPEYSRRFITTNPTISTEKFNEAVNLISNKFSVPDLIYQQTVVSDQEKDKAREIIKGLREQIKDICSNVKPGKNNVIIPFNESIIGLLPKEKSEDMTRANRLYTYLSFLPVVYFHNRPRITIVKPGDTIIQTIPIATFEDLKNTVSLMEYSDGVRPYILEWYYDVLLKSYEGKGDTPDSKTTIKINKKGEEFEEILTEERVAVTSKDLIKKHKEQHNEILTSHKLLQAYLYPLLNHGYIDSIDSNLDRRAKIYYPLIVTKKYINLFYLEEKNNLSQEMNKIVANSTTFPDQVFTLSVLQSILKYYSELGYIIDLLRN
ncbi:MAG TPA: hypothetical protein VFV86_06820 [Nitrososphaeraceae archaeon]|nr:hypothetical protein [Nitrososphaeraceae archaeon]